jgi:hypothetical protein
MKAGSVLLLGLLLAGCTGSGNWSKPGADPAEITREYQDCRELGDSAVDTQAKIDQDIQATRASDAQRTSIIRSDQKILRDQTNDRAEAIIASCMQAKGFVTPKK